MMSICYTFSAPVYSSYRSVMYLYSLTTGMLWPIESLPRGLQIVSKIFPVYYPAHGIRSIMIRGLLCIQLLTTVYLRYLANCNI